MDVSMLFVYVVWALTLSAFIYGVTSWCKIKKFRHFKNYVYLSVILSSLLRLTAFLNIFEMISPERILVIACYYFLTSYFSTVQNYWLLVICCIFYVEIVKVFSVDIHRRYLKSNLFAWGVPSITCLITKFVLPLVLDIESLTHEVRHRIYVNINIAIIVLPLFVNLIIYIIIVSALFRNSNAAACSATNKWRRFYIATLIFVLTDVVQLSYFIWDILKLPFDLQVVIVNLPTLAFDFFLPLVRSNRQLWREFYAKRSEKDIP